MMNYITHRDPIIRLGPQKAVEQILELLTHWSVLFIALEETLFVILINLLVGLIICFRLLKWLELRDHHE